MTAPAVDRARTQAGLGVAVLLMLCAPPLAAGDSARQDPGASAHAAPASLCEAKEQIMFSCAAGGKLISLCASSDFSKDTGYLQYRFGKPGAVELAYPDDLDGTQQRFQYQRYTRPQVTLLSVYFAHGDYEYEVYDDCDYEEDQGGCAAGVRVASSDIECTAPATGSLMDLEDFLPRRKEDSGEMGDAE